MCDKPCTQLHELVEFMAKTGQRDKIMALVQFVPAVLDPIVRSQGCATLGTRLQRLSTAADSYRTFTRFSWILDNANGKSWKALSKINDPVVRNLRQAETGILTVRFACEHLNYLTNWEVIPGQKGHWGRLGILLWFYALLLANVRQVYELISKNSSLSHATGSNKQRIIEDFQRTLLGWVVTVCFTFFNLSLQPAKGGAFPQLNSGKSAINSVLAAITPPQLPLSGSTRAVLGLTASVVDLYLCVTAPKVAKSE